jgi:hypothetical protein
VLYTGSFGAAAAAKLWIWRHAVATGLLKKNVGPEIERRIARRSLAVPLGCALAIGLSFVSVFVAPIGFALIPLFARVLDPTAKPKRSADDNTATESA